MTNRNSLRLLIIFSILLLPGVISAKKVSLEQARAVARTFYESRLSKSMLTNDFTVIKENIITEKDIPVIYIFDIAGNKGMILISADDLITPVLGYTLKGSYHSASLPPQFTDLLDTYRKQIYSRIQKTGKADDIIAEQWQKYISGQAPSAKSLMSVGPLVNTTWDQGQYYNDSCPADPNAWFNGHVPTGCVATALAQILKFYSYPYHGNGYHSYTHPVYGQLSANFGLTNYYWAGMPDALSGPDPDVAQLIYHCGVAVEMDYSPWASGAPSFNAALALIHYFDYDNSTQLVYRVNYTDPDWISLLTNELDHNRVCYYAGYGSAGHAFVLDGYDSDGFFHFNWGWSGYADGYFDIHNLDPAGNTFNNYQEVIIGITPGTYNPCSGLTNLSEPQGNFTDGSYAGTYQNNSDCRWSIQPSNNPVSIELKFLTFNTEMNNDYIKVYDGPNITAPLLGTYSGNSLPPVINSSGAGLFVHFLSNASVNSSGWTATYESKYCWPENTYIAPTGTFTDGSGTYDYRNNTDCKWLIQQPSNTTLMLSFDQFETEYNYDFVDVYDGPDTSSNLIGHFSGDTLPAALFSTGNSLFLHFTSDQGVTGNGWQANYTSSVGIPSLQAGNTLITYPNPAHDRLNIHLGIADGLPSSLKTEILDVTAKVIFSGVLPQSGGNLVLDLQSLDAAFYLLRLHTGNQVITTSFIKN